MLLVCEKVAVVLGRVLGWMDDDARRPRPTTQSVGSWPYLAFRHCHMRLAFFIIHLVNFKFFSHTFQSCCCLETGSIMLLSFHAMLRLRIS